MPAKREHCCRPSPLYLRQQGKHKAVVRRCSVTSLLGSGTARMFEYWSGGEKVYDPAAEYKEGQVLELKVPDDGTYLDLEER